ncbi:MAG: UvrD-helicase domain-containing protein [Planctomycetes bacterium]|jgi:DNA helicase-2/ATP-dependent DNA helicase PcrA|nr:UvrD-helicase domain-containing protein [Planctomycetota bacterium]MBT5102295.1 UvrD-helicase domain-containing protein [Planctomycetota bacterium]MBT7012627.1 UvrD-helicase domain-containing protein [Planctomycetota bacterium]MBT7318156.1 UvrD-helicase domain-containing protein [Planctomycetota bacterium]
MSQNLILDGLNPEQKRAVEYTDGPILILAGAGTGKTRTITRRVAHLVRDLRVPASKVLAITFTNKAAREMRTRIEEWVPHTGMWVGTFHATCARMLRIDADRIGRTRDFTIFDVDDRRRLLRQLIKDQSLDPKVFRPRRFENIISNWKGRSLMPIGAKAEAALMGMEEEHAATVYELYEAELAKQDALDFDDLLLKGVQLLQLDSDSTRRWVEKFEHILVDEYQDTNDLQYKFVKLLAQGTKHVAVCGDPDQSIYRWRGADISNILDFERDFPGAEIVRLEQNYRSVGNVLLAAQTVIKNNSSRKEKDLITNREAGEKLLLSEGADEETEARQMVQQVERWLEGGIRMSEVAIFYRTNACSRSLEAALTRMQIPYQVVGGQAFFERREVKDLLAFSRLLVNPKDDMSFQRAVNVPPRGVGETTLQRLRGRATGMGISLLAAIMQPEVRDSMRGPAKKGLGKFLWILDKGREELKSAERTLQVLCDVTGYRRFAESLDGAEDVDRGENLDELIAFAAEYDHRENGGLRGFLEEISLLVDTDRWAEHVERVSLMTVHAAKGLEFDCVGVVGLEEGLFPHVRSFDDPEGLEEERRLFYVALTRARLELCLSHSRMRFRTASPGPQASSRFLDELPKEVVIGGGKSYSSRAHSTSSGSSGGFASGFFSDSTVESCLPSARGVEVDASAGFESSAESEFQEGDWVDHRVFGNGTVQRILGEGVNQRITVLFENTDEERTLMLAYAMLEKLE